MNAIIVIIPLIIILVLRLVISGSNKQDKKSSNNDYWTHEREAKFARNKDISNIELLRPDITGLPFTSSNDQLIRLENKVRESAVKPMLDLHELSNTDIRINYGPANFPIISKYDQNFMYFTRDLYQLGKYLYNTNQHDDSRIVLEYLITISIDIGGAYTMLGNIYKENDEPDKITELIQIVEKSESFTKQSICNSLRDIINSY